MLSRNSHRNALIRALLSQSMLQASCQNFAAYTKVACDCYCVEQIFVVVVFALLLSPNILVNFSRKSSKS